AAALRGDGGPAQCHGRKLSTEPVDPLPEPAPRKSVHGAARGELLIMARHHQRRRLAWLLGAVPVSLVGLTLVWGHKLSDASFDLPFLFRSALSVPEVEIVYLDEQSRNSLNQTNSLWNRK